MKFCESHETTRSSMFQNKLCVGGCGVMVSSLLMCPPESSRTDSRYSDTRTLVSCSYIPTSDIVYWSSSGHCHETLINDDDDDDDQNETIHRK